MMIIIYAVIKLEKHKEDFFELKKNQHPSNRLTQSKFSPFLVASHQTIHKTTKKRLQYTLENQ